MFAELPPNQPPLWSYNNPRLNLTLGGVDLRGHINGHRRISHINSPVGTASASMLSNESEYEGRAKPAVRRKKVFQRQLKRSTGEWRWQLKRCLDLEALPAAVDRWF